MSDIKIKDYYSGKQMIDKLKKVVVIKFIHY
jgi:hypothetical protein